ncbi:MAG: WYL domain-containing protein [Fretibacterium sp.]|nr:WYL domain-containing protein [Fretibacterium sp.]
MTSFWDKIRSFFGWGKKEETQLPPTGVTPEPNPEPLPPRPDPRPPIRLGGRRPPYGTSRIRPPVDGDMPPSDPFHHFFTWLEDDPEYKKIYRKIERASKNVCLSCKQPVSVDDALPLHSPLAIHRSCYKERYDDLASTSSVEEARRRFQETPGKIALLYWTLAHWPTYPPDWEVRRERILKRDHYTCQECGSKNNLHIHHKIHIEDGGHHTSENLICLCKSCHEKAHGGRPIEPPDDPARDPMNPKPNHFTKTVRLLSNAIQEKQTVSFHYRDQKGEETDRTFSPQAFMTRHGYLCVKGFCHLRNDLRTFSVYRISKLTEIK